MTLESISHAKHQLQYRKEQLTHLQKRSLANWPTKTACKASGFLQQVLLADRLSTNVQILLPVKWTPRMLALPIAIRTLLHLAVRPLGAVNSSLGSVSFPLLAFLVLVLLKQALLPVA